MDRRGDSKYKKGNGEVRSIDSPRDSFGSALTWPQVIIRQHQLRIGEPRFVGHGRLVEHPFQLGHGVELQAKPMQREDGQAGRERIWEKSGKDGKRKDTGFNYGVKGEAYGHITRLMNRHMNRHIIIEPTPPGSWCDKGSIRVTQRDDLPYARQAHARYHATTFPGLSTFALLVERVEHCEGQTVRLSFSLHMVAESKEDEVIRRLSDKRKGMDPPIFSASSSCPQRLAGRSVSHHQRRKWKRPDFR